MKRSAEPEVPARSIARYLTHMNEETSSRISSSHAKHPRRHGTGIAGMSVPALSAFIRSMFRRRASISVRDKFVGSCYAALESFLSHAKMWEYEFRLHEGKAKLPPSNQDEVRKLSAKYSPWTSA